VGAAQSHLDSLFVLFLGSLVMTAHAPLALNSAGARNSPDLDLMDQVAKICISTGGLYSAQPATFDAMFQTRQTGGDRRCSAA
jgi:hypothetical protein